MFLAHITCIIHSLIWVGNNSGELEMGEHATADIVYCRDVYRRYIITATRIWLDTIHCICRTNVCMLFCKQSETNTGM